MIKSYQSSGKIGVKRVGNSAKRSIDRDRVSSADKGNGGSAPCFFACVLCLVNVCCRTSEAGVVRSEACPEARLDR